MASYVQSTLIGDEKVLYQAKLSVWSLLPLLVIGFLLLPLFGLGLLLWLIAYLRFKTTELAFTDKRVVAKFGIISRVTVELNLAKVESLQVNQGILGRIFGFGTVVVGGAGSPQAGIPNIDAPMTFRRNFMEHQDRAGKAA